jgi:hypothetical protein
MTIPSSGTISMLDIVKEFNSFPLGDIMTIATVVDVGGPFYRFTPRLKYVATTFTNGDILFADDFATNESRWGIIVGQVFSGTPAVTQSLVVNWRQFDALGNRVAPNNMVGALARIWRQADGGTMSLDRYYSGGSYVFSNAVGFPGGVSTPIPSSGAISLNNFYGAQSLTVLESSVVGANIVNLSVPPGTWNVLVRLSGAGGGDGGADSQAGTLGGPGTSQTFAARVTTNVTGRLALYGSSPGGNGRYSGSGNVAGTAGQGFLPGGEGGNAGYAGYSGTGGGGGGASAVLWYPDASTTAFVPVCAAGGGGGGCGGGRFVDASNPYALTQANNSPRWHTFEWNDFTSIATGPTYWWYDGENGRAYRIVPTLKGQGSTNLSDYYPPGTEPHINYDGGSAGGAGGGNGFPGGLMNIGVRKWYLNVSKDGSFSWQPPPEGTGSGGSQGYTFSSSSLIAGTGNYSGINTFAPANTGGRGQVGAVKIKVTNDLNDFTYPTA